MAQVPAKIKINGKLFEVIVDCDKAMAFRRNKNQSLAELRDILQYDGIFSDFKKGIRVTEGDIMEAFKTMDIYAVTQKIINDGEVQVTQEYRDKQRELKEKQILDFLIRNCADPRTGAPYTHDRLTSAMKQAGAKVDENKGVDEQALLILKQLEKVIPIKISVKKLKIIIPAMHTGRVYGLFKDLKKEGEDWLSDGSMSIIINIPAGMQLEFYDKLNALTQGTAITEEISST